VSRDRDELRRVLYPVLERLRRGEIEEAIAFVERVLGAPILCTECGTRFGWPGQLDAHMRRVHGEQ
jgi:hypothetical protein